MFIHIDHYNDGVKKKIDVYKKNFYRLDKNVIVPFSFVS